MSEQASGPGAWASQLLRLWRERRARRRRYRDTCLRHGHVADETGRRCRLCEREITTRHRQD